MKVCPKCGKYQKPVDDDGDRYYYNECPCEKEGSGKMEDRKKVIGGSEIAAIMGLSRWTTPLRIWAEKIGEIERKDLSDKEYVQLGNELEDFVAKKFEKETGMKVRRDTRTFTHPKHNYLVAHIDRRITGSDALLECKTCSAWKAKEWEGEEIPTEYIMQVIWYMGITGMLKSAYIAVLIGGQKFRYKEIKFDQELYDKMIDAAVHFMEFNILENNPPIAVASDNETLLELHPDPKNEKLIEATEDIETALDLFQELSKHITEMNKEKKEIEAKIKQVIGSNAGLRTPKYKVFWSKIKKDEYVVKAQEFRLLRITKRKEIVIFGMMR